MKFYNLWVDLDNTNSTNEKISLLSNYKSCDTTKKILYYTYNSYYNYGIREVPDEAWNATQEVGIPGNEFEKIMFNTLDKLRKRELTGNKAKEELINIAKLTTDENIEILNAILNRDLDCGISTKTINKVWNNLIPTFEIAKANPYSSDKNIKFPCNAEIKMNGIRMIIVVDQISNISIYSSNGNIINGLDFLKDQVRKICSILKTPRLVLDGEFTGTNRKSISGYINKFLKDTYTDKDMRYIKDNGLFTVFDVLPLKVWLNKSKSRPMIERYRQCKKLLSQDIDTPNISLIKSITVNSHKEIQNFFDEVYKNGEEGLIIKDLDAPYAFKRSDNFLKIKGENEADLIITGYTEGGGKRYGYIGAIICESSCGKVQVSVGSGITDDELEYITNNKDKLIGSVITVRYNEIIKDKNSDKYSLFLPRLVELRTDKLVADDINKILSETNGSEL